MHGRGDPELLTQMLANLVENALTHTPVGTRDRALLQRHGRPPACGGLARSMDRGYRTVEPDESARALCSPRPQPLDARQRPGLSLVAAVAELHGIELRLEDNHPGLRVIMDLSALQTTSTAPEANITAS